MYNKANKATLSELNKTHEIVKLLSTSLARAHTKAEAVSKKLGLSLKSDTLVDGRHTHKEYVEAHLDLMMFLLKEGDLYLSWSRCKELWETLVANPNSIQMDHDLIFTWFTCFIGSQLFNDSSCKHATGYFTKSKIYTNINHRTLGTNASRTLAPSVVLIGIF